MKRLCLIILLLTSLFAISSCKKETIILPSPSIKITKIATTGLTSYKVTVGIDRGEGQNIERAYLQLEDVTVRSNDHIILDLALNTEDHQTITKSFNTNLSNHDFIVEAFLETDLYTYSSGQEILRSIKNIYTPWFYPDELYAIPNENIGLTLNPGEKIPIIVDYINDYVPNEVSVKLNENYVLESSFGFGSGNGLIYSDHISSFGSATVPQSIPPGDYSVDLYIEGQHVVCPKKIRILAGNWTPYEENYPGEQRGEYAWFVLQDKLFLVGGSFYVTALDFSPLWEYDLTNKVWRRRNNFPHLTEDPDWIINTNILPYNLQYMDNGYILLRSFQNLELWKYSQPNDQWDKVARYPGIGENYLVAFILNGYLYAGGGVDNSNPTAFEPTRTTEFFRFNLTSLQWEKLNDLPGSLTGTYYYSITTLNDEAYVLEPDRKLWTYKPATDEWIQKNRFPGPWRLNSKLVSNGENIFLLGGEYNTFSAMGNMIPPLKDCWKYSPGSDEWEQQVFLPAYISRGIAFNYDDHIYAGLGYIIESAYNNNSQNIFRFSLTNN